jgi:hypothetical protein
MEVASFVLSLVAIGIAAVAAGYARRGAMASEDSARESMRSADAAQEAISYQRDDVERNRVVFSLEPVGHDGHLLRNDGTHSAFGVHVDTGGLGVDNPITDYDEFRAGQVEEYMLLLTMGVRTTHVTVTWHQQADRSDEQRRVELYVEH